MFGKAQKINFNFPDRPETESFLQVPLPLEISISVFIAFNFDWEFKDNYARERERERETPSEAFEPSHFQAAECRTWRYQKRDEMTTWKSIYHNHSIATLLSPQSPQTPPRVTKSVKTMIRTLSSSPLMELRFLPERDPKKGGTGTRLFGTTLLRVKGRDYIIC